MSPPIPSRLPSDPLPSRSSKLAAHFGWVFGTSFTLSLILAAFFWWICTNPPFWFSDGFFGTPLGLLEPFEAISQILDEEPVYLDESGDTDEPVEAGAEPAMLWSRWTLEGYLSLTGKENPYLVEPGADTPEKIAKRKEAFKIYQTALEPIREKVEWRANAKAFFIDFIAYFFIFSLTGSLVVFLLHEPASFPDPEQKPPTKPQV